MVVVSGSWVKNVVAYPSPAMSSTSSLVSDMVINMNNNNNNNINGNGTTNGTANNNTVVPGNGKPLCAKAVLTCRPNSHPFQERTLLLDQPVKVGRSVARARATSSNAIFDCKVLSRHHALLWYECGKFYLQDTKSSNGTFVNNNRLSSNESEPQEVSSGDIVQFGVDVVENNRKVTHGCIIASLKLYLPDGKEAKASPSITEGNRHGMVPLDELYKLNQIIQEASQREQCLETKLTTLTQVVEKAKRSADDSWQAYVGEERLLSKISALESQINQAGKTMTDERLREELTKLQEDSVAYQVAAKKTLDKLHNEKLDALALFSEEQRARETAEQEAMLAKAQLTQIQLELQDIAQKLVEEQKKADEEKARLEQREREFLGRLDAGAQTITELQNKLKIYSNKDDELLPLEQLEKYSVIYDLDMKDKEELLGENEVSETDLNRTNGIVQNQNHISLTVAPVTEVPNVNRISSELQSQSTLSEQGSFESCATLIDETFADILDDNDNENDNYKDDTPERAFDTLRSTHEPAPNRSDADDNIPCKEKHEEETADNCSDRIDSKTLKYQYQSMQIELKKQIEQMEILSMANQARICELEDQLREQMEFKLRRSEETEQLKEELLVLETKFKATSNEAQQLRDKNLVLVEDLRKVEDNLAQMEATKTNSVNLVEDHIGSGDKPNNISNDHITVEHLGLLEEELVIIKEKCAQLNEEKTALNNSLASVREEYNILCNRNHNQMFFYIAPLVLMVLYLLISSMFS